MQVLVRGRGKAAQDVRSAGGGVGLEHSRQTRELRGHLVQGSLGDLERDERLYRETGRGDVDVRAEPGEHPGPLHPVQPGLHRCPRHPDRAGQLEHARPGPLAKRAQQVDVECIERLLLHRTSLLLDRVYS